MGGKMGTNYYIRKARPFESYPTFHVCKLSAGWNVHFQDSEENRDGSSTADCPAFHSAADIRNLLSSGEWALADENGRIWEGDAALEKFASICSRRGGDLKDCYLGRDYRDPEGFLFSPTEFS